MDEVGQFHTEGHAQGHITALLAEYSGMTVQQMLADAWVEAAMTNQHATVTCKQEESDTNSRAGQRNSGFG